MARELEIVDGEVSLLREEDDHEPASAALDRNREQRRKLLSAPFLAEAFIVPDVRCRDNARVRCSLHERGRRLEVAQGLG